MTGTTTKDDGRIGLRNGPDGSPVAVVLAVGDLTGELALGVRARIGYYVAECGVGITGSGVTREDAVADLLKTLSRHDDAALSRLLRVGGAPVAADEDRGIPSLVTFPHREETVQDLRRAHAARAKVSRSSVEADDDPVIPQLMRSAHLGETPSDLRRKLEGISHHGVGTTCLVVTELAEGSDDLLVRFTVGDRSETRPVLFGDGRGLTGPGPVTAWASGVPVVGRGRNKTIAVLDMLARLQELSAEGLTQAVWGDPEARSVVLSGMPDAEEGRDCGRVGLVTYRKGGQVVSVRDALWWRDDKGHFLTRCSMGVVGWGETVRASVDDMMAKLSDMMKNADIAGLR